MYSYRVQTQRCITVLLALQFILNTVGTSWLSAALQGYAAYSIGESVPKRFCAVTYSVNIMRYGINSLSMKWKLVHLTHRNIRSVQEPFVP